MAAAALLGRAPLRQTYIYMWPPRRLAKAIKRHTKVTCVPPTGPTAWRGWRGGEREEEVGPGADCMRAQAGAAPWWVCPIIIIFVPNPPGHLHHGHLPASLPGTASRCDAQEHPCMGTSQASGSWVIAPAASRLPRWRASPAERSRGDAHGTSVSAPCLARCMSAACMCMCMY